ncbi:MAG TPA: hypothetical protein VGF85_03760 [Opitutaceae bacterium]
MSERLDEYRRQRALLKEHLEWLDRQIAGLEGRPAPDSPPPPSLSEDPGPDPAPPRLSPRPSDLDAEAILSQYRQPEGALRNDARRGCLLFFALGLALTALAVVALFLLLRRAHGH